MRLWSLVSSHDDEAVAVVQVAVSVRWCVGWLMP